MSALERENASDYLEGLMEGFVAYDGNWRMTYMDAAGGKGAEFVVSLPALAPAKEPGR